MLASADRVLVLTGAGISAESGVPTFRGAQGLWNDLRPEELATPEAFRRDPRQVWEWYGWRRELVAACRPNPGHTALASWLDERASGACLATQNVDGLHTRAAEDLGAVADAGPDEWASEVSGTIPDTQRDHTGHRTILELHGSLFRARCTRCGWEGPHRDLVNAASRDTLPACRHCKGLLRPAVVWYGEMLPPRVVAAAFQWARSADAALVVGTSALVHPAASLPLETLYRGGTIVEVNVEPTELTDRAAVSLRGPAGTVLPLLLGMGETPRV
ncbi:MAG: NAD-dependent deacylase [Gemmatimonadales bacterium]|nr:MAG: NAD-dependent deacylase [Gemmatimonadales bacterium]